MTTLQTRLDFPIRKSSRITNQKKSTSCENSPTPLRKSGRARRNKENDTPAKNQENQPTQNVGVSPSKKQKDSPEEPNFSLHDNVLATKSTNYRKSLVLSPRLEPNTPTISKRFPSPSHVPKHSSAKPKKKDDNKENIDPLNPVEVTPKSPRTTTDLPSGFQPATNGFKTPTKSDIIDICGAISPRLCGNVTPCDVVKSPRNVSRRIFDDSPPNVSLKKCVLINKSPSRRFESFREPGSPRKRNHDSKQTIEIIDDVLLSPVTRSSPRKPKTPGLSDKMAALATRSSPRKLDTKSARKPFSLDVESPKANDYMLSPRKSHDMMSPRKREFLSPRKQLSHDMMSPRKQQLLSPRKQLSHDMMSPRKQLSHDMMSPTKRLNMSSKPPIPQSPGKIKSCPSTPNKFLSPMKKPILSFRRPDATAYQKAKQALHTSLPSHLIGRDREIQHVDSFIRNHLNDATAGSLYISGAPGTGKTAVVSHVLAGVKEGSKFKSVYINCMSLRDSAAIFTKITSDLTGKQMTCRSAKDAVTFLTKYFTSTGRSVILILDEIDQLDSHKQEVLYTMFEWPSLPKSRLLLIGIANALDLTDRMLPRLQARPKCRPELMNFTPYSKDQIVQILQDRLQEITTANGCVLEPSAIQFCARKVSAVAGDMRKALDVCRRAVEMVERDVKSQSILRTSGCPESPVKTHSAHAITKKINIKHISAVVAEVYSSNVQVGSDQHELPLQQKLVICSLLVLLKQAKKLEVTLGKLHETYCRVCRKRNMTPVDQSEFHSLCNLIETRGILVVKKAKDSRSSKIVLKYDLNELEHALQDKMLISAILKENTT